MEPLVDTLICEDDWDVIFIFLAFVGVLISLTLDVDGRLIADDIKFPFFRLWVNELAIYPSITLLDFHCPCRLNDPKLAPVSAKMVVEERRIPCPVYVDSSGSPKNFAITFGTCAIAFLPITWRVHFPLRYWTKNHHRSFGILSTLFTDFVKYFHKYVPTLTEARVFLQMSEILEIREQVKYLKAMVYSDQNTSNLLSDFGFLLRRTLPY